MNGIRRAPVFRTILCREVMVIRMKKILSLAAVLLLQIALFCGAAVSVSADEGNYIDVAGAKTIYFVGGEFDGAGIDIVYGGFHIPSERLSVSGFSTAAVGDRSVTVSYGDMSKTFTIKVYEKVSSVRLIGVGYKTSYFVGERFSGASMKLQLIYENGETGTLDVNDKWIKGFDSSLVTENQTVTIDFGGITTSFDVEIRPIEYPETNFETVELTETVKAELEKSRSNGGKTAFIVAWAVCETVLVGCFAACLIVYARRKRG